MTKTKQPSRTADPDDAIRDRIIERAKKYNAEILKRFTIAAEDFANNNHRAAMGALDGIDSTLQEFRTLLRLMERR
jgi:CMP-N-acetylneuraminic acid synthetase